MAVDDVYKVTLNAGGQGSIYQNVFNLQTKLAGDPTPANFSTFVTDWLASCRNEQSSSVTYTHWDAVQQWGPNMSIDAPKCRRLNAKQFTGVISPGVGGNSNQVLPPQSAMVVTWVTGTAGRRKRGRTYLFGLCEDQQDAGLWGSAFLLGQTSRITTFSNIYKDDTGTSPNFTLGIWSERTASGCVPATPPQKGHVQLDTPHPELAFTPISGFVLRDTVYTQRRRTRGVGR